ncbi:hypothetical protein ACFSTE_18240 [Aquimarina hainanensis]|uniref:DUF4136 domain-containing protein n=1 Tax=Aquimarina hainanensis TaxID=1578017 RepID=A0ABW5NBR2_9FLAO|nr:hypothetical protein [Aquimarina sp. TRL1]QKX06727.1 hypothetical protein HN014_17990 [Aquimarina sp. TRL1]
MKKLGKFLGLVIMITAFVGCSSVKVTHSWKDIKTENLKGKNILVMCKTKDDIARIQFEDDITDELNQNGYTAHVSYKTFPDISTDKNDLTTEEIENVKTKLKGEGVDVVVMTVLKDIKKYTTTTASGSTGYYVSTYPGFYRRGYYRGFYSYYGSVYIDTAPVMYTTSSGKKYILETVFYDLKQPEKNQLISVITTELDNPETLGTTSTDFSKKIVKELLD